MSSKVIKWFKRQASIRRFTDKGEETTSTSKSESGEKKKNPFTRLGSFRRKKKKSSDSDSSIVGISKRYSYSVPDEMEAGTKDPSVTIISNSISLENSMSSPSRFDSPTKSSASDLSYHSSYDNEAHSSEFSRECSPTDNIVVGRPQLEPHNTCIKKDISHNGFVSSSKSQTADTKRRQDVIKGNSIPIIVISQPVASPGKPPLAAVESYSSDDLSCLSDVEETDVVNSEHGSNENFKEIDRLIEKTQTDLRNSEISCDLDHSLAKSEEEMSCKTSKNITDNVLSSPGVSSKNVPDSNFNSKGDIVVIEMLENTELIIYESDDEKCVPICDSSVIPVTVNTSQEMENDDRNINDNTETINLEFLRIDESQDSPSDIKLEENQSSDSFTISTPSSPNSGQDIDASSIDSIDTDSEDDDKETVIDKSTFNQEVDVISLMTNESNDQDDNISATIQCQNDINEKIKIEDSENKVESVNEYEIIKCEQVIEDIDKVESIHVHNVLSEEKICQQNVEDSEIRDEVKETCDLFTVDKNENKVLSVSDKDDVKNIEECNKDAKIRNEDAISDIVSSEIKVKEKSKQETEQKTIFGKTEYSDVNEIKDFQKEACVENVNNKSKDIESNDTIDYPIELNPFDSDVENICNNSKPTVYYKEKENDTKENGSNPFGSDTEIEEENDTKERGSNPFGSDNEIEEEYNKHMRQSQTRLQIHDKDFCRVSTENLNDLSSRRSETNSPQSHSRRKYDGSNDYKASMKYHFSVEDLTSRIDYRPNLPPKTEKRKNISGSLVPTPRPRKSKLHGSTTSLQNLSSVFPVAAPRSITPCGSTRTLNESSTNPFADDMDDDEEDTSSGIFDRRSCGRNTVQDSSSTAVSFVRNNMDRGSLPPSSRGRKKKRPAPAPPSGVLSNKPPKPVSGVHARRRSPSLDSPSKNFTPTKINSPFRPAPPRPPPPRI